MKRLPSTDFEEEVETDKERSKSRGEAKENGKSENTSEKVSIFAASSNSINFCQVLAFLGNKQ